VSPFNGALESRAEVFGSDAVRKKAMFGEDSSSCHDVDIPDSGERLESRRPAACYCNNLEVRCIRPFHWEHRWRAKSSMGRCVKGRSDRA